MFRHFLQTRFNLKRHPKDRFGNDTLTDDWMVKRFDLFERYCFPSVSNQSATNFEWLVYFDADTKDNFRERVHLYQKNLSNFVPLFLAAPDYKSQIRESITSRLSPYDEYVITSRIDNDDAIHRDFLLEVEKLFDNQNNTFFRFLNGYQFQEDTHLFLKMRDRCGNHFSSRIESDTKGIDSVINVDNQKIQEIPNVEIVDIDSRKRLWLEVVHDTNVANHNRILLPEFAAMKLRNEFNLDLKINGNNMAFMLYRFAMNKIGSNRNKETHT